MDSSNGKIKERERSVAAVMKRQPFFPVCAEALAEWKRRTMYRECNVAVKNALLDTNTAVWLDKQLFIDALADLLEFAARSSAGNDNLTLALATNGINSYRVMIDYMPTPAYNVETPSQDLRGRFSDQTRQIISQHGACLEFSEGRQVSRITIRIP